jgi:hypothetical protein
VEVERTTIDARVPVVLAIDVEPDDRWPTTGVGVPLQGFLRTAAWLDELRGPLSDATGLPAAFTWYIRMDPQVERLAGRADAIVASARETFDRLAAAGDTFGLHTHAGRWLDGDWVLDQADPDWIAHCVDTNLRAYEAAFGRPCTEHRFGDCWSSPALFDQLAARGVRVDLTIEPGQRQGRPSHDGARTTGRVPSYLDAPRESTRHDGGPLWLLPMTSADPGPTLAAPKRIARRVRYLGQPLHRTLLLNRPWFSPADPWELAEQRIAEMDRPYLAFVLRSDIAIRDEFGRTAAVLQALLRRPLARRLEFTSGVGVVSGFGG